MAREEKNIYGQRVVDYFSQQAQDPYEQADSLAGFDRAKHIVKVLFQMGKVDAARQFILTNTFLHALSHRFEAHSDILAILRPFFPTGWSEIPHNLQKKGGVSLARRASVALRRIGALREAFSISEASLRIILDQKRLGSLCSQLLDLASTAGEQNHLAQEERLLCLAGEAAALNGYETEVLGFKLARFRQLSRLGRWEEALVVRPSFEATASNSNMAAIDAHHYAVHMFMRGELKAEHLTKAEELSHSAKSALGKRNLCGLRGFWELSNNDMGAAKQSLQDAISLAHKAGKIDRRSEIYLAIVKHKLGELSDSALIAEQFEYNLDAVCFYPLGELWYEIGNINAARKHALAAYRWALADGEPFVRRFELTKSTELLKKIAEVVSVPPKYSPNQDSVALWEDTVSVLISKDKRRRARQRETGLGGRTGDVHS